MSWNGVSIATTTDWIGLYTTSSAAGGAFVDWKYTSACSHTAGPTAIAGADCVFNMPASAGTTYQFRLFSHDGTLQMQTAGPITVTPPPPTTLAAAPTTCYQAGRQG